MLSSLFVSTSAFDSGSWFAPSPLWQVQVQLHIACLQGAGCCTSICYYSCMMQSWVSLASVSGWQVSLFDIATHVINYSNPSSFKVRSLWNAECRLVGSDELVIGYWLTVFLQSFNHYGVLGYTVVCFMCKQCTNDDICYIGSNTFVAKQSLPVVRTSCAVPMSILVHQTCMAGKRTVVLSVNKVRRRNLLISNHYSCELQSHGASAVMAIKISIATVTCCYLVEIHQTCCLYETMCIYCWLMARLHQTAACEALVC
jgi:hypothetical protein